MLLADVVAVSGALSGTRSKTAKVEALAGLLGRLAPDEIVPAVGFLVGTVRPGRTGIGWATLRSVDVPNAPAPTLTVHDVDHAVADVAGTTGPGSVGARRDRLAELFGRATETEAGFLRRLLLGELRQGALEGVMTDAIARAAAVPVADVRRAAMLSGDLCETARLALTGGRDALGGVHLQVLRPVQPMLAASAESVVDALAATGPASVEWKLDGARIQVHRAGDDVRVFTRNLNDVTERLPEVVAAARLFEPGALVLDGEVIGVGDDARPRRFQDTMSRFETQQIDEHGVPLTALFFDCLHVDGEDLITRPLSERLDVLASFAGERRIPGTRTADPSVAADVLASALSSGHEGVMVKALDSTYDAGRRGAAWRKVKPVHTLDLVVLAVEWGSGRRQGWLSNLHLGARLPDGEFVMVGKTFKGMTDELLAWQTERLQAIATGSEGHIVHVRPELVVEIALDGVQASRRYAGGVALRFARVRGYRPDKSPAEADTIDAVRALLAP
jgi:DNA ligase 1